MVNLAFLSGKTVAFYNPRVADLINNLSNDYRFGPSISNCLYPSPQQIDALLIVKPH